MGGPLSQKSRRLSVSIVIIIIIVLNITVHPAYLFTFSLFSFLHLRYRVDSVTGSHAQRKYIPSSPFHIFSSFFSSSSRTLIFFTHDCVRKRCRQRIYPDIHPSLPLITLTRAPVCKSSPYAFAPYAARCASSASLCRHNGDIGTGAPCHIPTSDDSSGCSSACKPCRRPDN